MQQTQDFLEETRVLDGLLSGFTGADWDRLTRFKGWTGNDILVHLHFWNRMVDLSLRDADGFAASASGIAEAMPLGGLRPIENARIAERGAALRAVWRETVEDIATRWRDVDPRRRLPWMGPDMSARSSMTARQMETWAHGQALFDLLGQDRPESDRIKNIVILGVNAFGWSHKVNGLDVPDQVPQLHLTAPSGDAWAFGDAAASDRIDGTAVEFAQVVTQTRNIADTALQVTGPVATRWMETAQCFAGPPQSPPPPGSRRKG